MHKQKCSASKKTLEGLSGGIMLIGLGILFMPNSIPFWPWILLVVGLASLPGSIANKGLWAGLQGFVWMAGIAILFGTRLGIWPGVLILAGISTMAGALVQPPALQKQKRGATVRAGFGDIPDDEYEYMRDEI